MALGAFVRTLLQSRQHVLLAIGFSFFSSLMLLTLPIYTLQLFNRVMVSHSVATLVALVVIALFLLMVQTALDFARGQLLQQTGHKLDFELTPPLLLSAIDDSARHGKSSRQGLNDLAQVRTFLLNPSSSATLELPWVPLFLVVLYFLHPSFALLALLGAGLLLLLSAGVYRISKPLLTKQQRTDHDSERYLNDYLTHSHIIQSMGMGPCLSLLWRDKNGQNIAQRWQLNSRFALLNGVSRGVRQGIQVGLLALGVYLVMQQQIGPGAVIAASMLSGRFFAPIEPAMNQWRTWRQAYQSYRRLLEYGQTVDGQEHKLPLPRPQGELLVNNVSFIPAGQKLPLLKQIGFRLAAGKALAILGGSGEGKSTLLHLLLGMKSPSAGELRIDGAALNQWPPETLGQYIGYLPQEIDLINGTIAQNIGRFGEENDELILHVAQLTGVHELITMLPKGYETRIEDAQLSAGQRQRIGLARALYGHPQILLLDEPATNLDPAGERALVQALTYCRQAKITVVMVTHAPLLLAQADWIIALKNGAIAQAGPAQQFLSSNALSTRTTPAEPSSQTVPASANTSPALSSSTTPMTQAILNKALL